MTAVSRRDWATHGVYRSTARSDKVGTQFVRQIDYFELDAISRRWVDGVGGGDIVMAHKALPQ